jgi:hypothetical protein
LVHGSHRRMPFSAQHPVSLYAVKKQANEWMAHTYSPLTGYYRPQVCVSSLCAAPEGRPDIAPMLLF